MNNIIRLSTIQNHYGGSDPVYLSEYYLNNGYVNSSSYIPEEGNTISFSHFDYDMNGGAPQHVACITSNNGFNVNLNTINDWHTQENLDPLITGAFSNFYQYRYDGSSNNSNNAVYFINDGGRDMYDGGNYIDISGNCITEFINVAYGTINTEPTHGYYVTPINVWPNTTIVYVQEGTARINIHGNVGSDGDGTVTNDKTTYTTSNDRYGTIFYNANGEDGDPSILDVWFTIANSNWESILTGSNDQRKTNDDNNYNHSVGVTGSNYIFVKTLLALSNGVMPSTMDVKNYIEAYVYDLPINITASNVNIDNRIPVFDGEIWND
jgi:hypothetical protein